MMNLVLFLQLFTAVGFLMPIDKAIMSVGRPKMKRDAGVKAVFLLEVWFYMNGPSKVDA